MSLNEPAAAPAVQTHGPRILAILSTLMAFASISTDLYLPALPAMGAALHASAGTIELTISGYLIGFSLGQLAWGPVGDRYGRRLPIAIGLVLFIVGSAGCAMSTSAAMMIGWRALQAVGACASVVLARAMVRDLFTGHRAAQMLSTLMTVMAIAPLLGPSVGGLILHVASWRAIFWTLVGVGLATLAALRGLPETLPPPQRSREPLRRALIRYAELLRHRRLLGYAGAGGFFYGGMYAYIAGTPFAYITYHHVSPQVYGLLFGAGIVGIMVTNQINARLVARFGGDRLMRAGTVGAALAGALLALDAWADWGGLMGLVLPLFLFISATGFIVANSIAGALGSFPARAGSVSALIGSLQYGSGIVGSALVGAFANGTPWPMGCVIALAGLGSVLCARLVASPEPSGIGAARPDAP
ncbi:MULTISPECIES: multidrug effflux MFS transporter [Ralstonia solanacearum species complex]|uniref:Bcr/CflA family efflux transporter n=1 Tax=Ralstonia syzygii TaxID=28097 RepID=A0ABX7ZMC1_9RALS|nr:MULTISPECIES: multidrug effflux MFS transporter [Ralstonia solanacearum species complex]BEU73766.1 Bcr/CflA family multidrug efflux MFS transporter [Ralstonia pseudosolanacearum]AMP39320.1 Bcr/CflA family drug resistance efflux transporter [Ralstonia solanacearum]AXV78706.1 Bcr/CflA family drug resistance efflux transporter [Ralstonia solanacearum]AXV88156.1 Bcr/CflA family drug resistance efflux transporter [Ralstonia solanacearum]AXV92728.1 Bcr/CflA family drug resistance efflux transport